MKIDDEDLISRILNCEPPVDPKLIKEQVLKRIEEHNQIIKDKQGHVVDLKNKNQERHLPEIKSTELEIEDIRLAVRTLQLALSRLTSEEARDRIKAFCKLDAKANYDKLVNFDSQSSHPDDRRKSISITPQPQKTARKPRFVSPFPKF